MALFYAFSMRFRSLNRQVILWTWRSRLHRSASVIGPGGNSRTAHEHGCSFWPPKCRKSLLQNHPMFCSSASDTKIGVKEFHLIYKFPGIRICKVITRLKLLQSTLTVMVLPPLYYYYTQGQVAESTVLYFTGIAVFAGVMLYSLTYYLQRIIGMMYINQEATTLKVSHLTFWGKRKDVYIPVEDVKSLSETGDYKGETILQFRRYSRPDTLYFTLSFGQILDENIFCSIFGRMQ